MICSVATHPAAIPILSTTSCQYLVENPIKIRDRENTNTQAERRRGRDILKIDLVGIVIIRDLPVSKEPHENTRDGKDHNESRTC